MCENLISKFSNSWDNIQINNLDNNDINDLIIKNIETAATETLPETFEQIFKQPWQNDEKLREIIVKKINSLIRMLIQKMCKNFVNKFKNDLDNSEMNTSKPKQRNLMYLLQQENLTNYSPLLKDKLRL